MRPRHAISAGVLPAAASAAAAQGIGDLGPSFTPLPSPPLIEHLVLEQPWPIVLVLVMAGLVGFVALNRAARLRAGLITLAACLALAAASILTATLVTTTREHLKDRARQLIAATVAGDSAALDEILAEQARLSIRFLGDRDKPQIIDAAKNRLPAVVSAARVVEAKVSIDASNAARTHIRVRTEGSAPPNSWWRVDWQLEPASAGDANPKGTWRVVRIKPLWILGVEDPAG